MSINKVYIPDPTFAGQAIAQAGAAEYQQAQDDRLTEIERFNAQMAQREAEFNSQLAYQATGQALNYATNQDQLAQQAYDNAANRDASLYGRELGMQYELADTALRGNLQAAMNGQQTAGMMARDMQESRLKQAMSEHDAIQKAWLDGEHFTSDAQFRQAKSAWENKWGELGLTWGLPDQIAQQQAQQNDDMVVGQIESSFFTNPIDGASLIQPGAVQSMLQLGMEPKEIAQIGVKMQAEARQRAALKQKETIDQTKYEDAKANIERDDERAAQQLEHTQQSHQQKMAFAEEQAKQKMLTTAINNFQAAKQKRAATRATAKDASALTNLGPEPKLEDFLPPGFMQQQESGQVKTIDSQTEYDALKPGEEYIDASTGTRARK